MSSLQFYDEEQNLDIEVTPSKHVALVVDLEVTKQNGAVVVLTADMMERIIAVWREDRNEDAYSPAIGGQIFATGSGSSYTPYTTWCRACGTDLSRWPHTPGCENAEDYA